MKRFRFGLEKVLKVKQLRERLAEAKLAQARQALDAAEQLVNRVREAIARVGVVVEGMVGEVLQPEQWTATFEHANQLARALGDAEASQALARRQYDEAAEARKAIATEVEALKGLRKQQWDEHRSATQKAEQERLDELGLQRWSGGGQQSPSL